LLWDWNQNQIQIYNPIRHEWESIPYEMRNAEPGYNPNIGENMYVEEMKHFIEAVEGKHPFINTLENDHKVLKLLYAIEESDKTSKYLKFNG